VSVTPSPWLVPLFPRGDCCFFFRLTPIRVLDGSFFFSCSILDPLFPPRTFAWFCSDPPSPLSSPYTATLDKQLVFVPARRALIPLHPLWVFVFSEICCLPDSSFNWRPARLVRVPTFVLREFFFFLPRDPPRTPRSPRDVQSHSIHLFFFLHGPYVSFPSVVLTSASPRREGFAEGLSQRETPLLFFCFFLILLGPEAPSHTLAPTQAPHFEFFFLLTPYVGVFPPLPRHRLFQRPRVFLPGRFENLPSVVFSADFLVPSSPTFAFFLARVFTVPLSRSHRIGSRGLAASLIGPMFSFRFLRVVVD